jgi:hypothetical protein
VAYVPVLAVAVLVCAAVAVGDGRWRRVTGPVTALVALAVAAPLVAGAAAKQNALYESVNTHDLVFTLVLRELGPTATGPLGLPPQAAAYTGNGYFNGPPRPEEPWWRSAVFSDPGPTRRAALELLARHPGTVVRAVGVGLQATTLADLPYLASTPADPGFPSPPSGHPGWSGARQPDLQAVLDGTRRPPWAPGALVLLAAIAVAAIPLTRRRAPAAARWSVAAGLAALTALGLVVVAVLGDGYFEVFKHVWPASYLLVVTALCLAGAALAAVPAVTGGLPLGRRRPGRT